MPRAKPNVKSVFAEALEIESPDARQEWLDRACAGHPELHRDVQRLLEAFEKAGSFLDPPAKTAKAAALLPPAFPDRYRAEEEIARGGMGAVWRVVDRQFDRLLAIKVMLPIKAADGVMQARFEREAELHGSLQHPAIPPVVERDLLDDGAPFFSMKLIKGNTLSELLAARLSPADELPRFVGIFKQICQAVGYAHSQNVIHRDLKPANVMVGAFGEVQLMDWGMAKRIGEPDKGSGRDTSPMTADSETPPHDAETVEFGDADASATDDGLTRAGTVMGTLAYMPPEQARGEIDKLDARSDVFGLGAMLLHILTGERLFTGENLWRQAFNAELEPAFDRLDRADADRELIDLCRNCLAAEPGDRPENGSAVADEIDRYQRAVQQRLERERAERAAAQVRAAEERKRRRVLLWLAGAVMLLIAGGTGAAWWYKQDRIAEETRAAIESRNAEREIAGLLSRSTKLRNLYDFTTAEALLIQADGRIKQLQEPDELKQKVFQARKDLRCVKKLDAIRLRKNNDPNVTDAMGRNGELATAFCDYGIDLTGIAPADRLGERIRSSNIKEHLLAGLDYWADIDVKLRPRILAVANAGDTDPIRIQLRNPAQWHDRGLLIRLARQLNRSEILPATALSLAQRLSEVGESERARELLIDMAQRHPADFWVQYRTGGNFSSYAPKSAEEAIGYFRAAITSRPDNSWAYNYLGSLLDRKHRKKQAKAMFTRAIELDPRNSRAHSNLGLYYAGEGRIKDAERCYRLAIQIDPEFTLPQTNLATLLIESNRFKEAEALCRKTIAIDGKDAKAQIALATVFSRTTREQEAVTVLTRLLQSHPDDVNALVNLGVSLVRLNQDTRAESLFRKAIQLAPRNPSAYNGLGVLLARTGRIADAEKAYRRAITINKRYQESYVNLANLLARTGSLREAESASRIAIRLNPNDPKAHLSFGNVMELTGRSDVAVEAFRHVTRLNPRSAGAYSNLGLLLMKSGRDQQAEEALRTALKLDPRHLNAHMNLGILLMRKTDAFAKAVECIQRGRALASPGQRRKADALLAMANQLLQFDRRLKRVQSGAEELNNPQDALLLADFAYTYKRQPAMAVKLYMQGFERTSPPRQLRSRIHYNAGCALVQVAAGQVERGATKPRLPEAARHRNLALRLLTTNLTELKNAIRVDHRLRKPVLNQFRHWLADSDLASVRGAAIGRLPVDEQAGWQRFWSIVSIGIKAIPVVAPKPLLRKSPSIGSVGSEFDSRPPSQP